MMSHFFVDRLVREPASTEPKGPQVPYPPAAPDRGEAHRLRPGVPRRGLLKGAAALCGSVVLAACTGGGRETVTPEAGRQGEPADRAADTGGDGWEPAFEMGPLAERPPAGPDNAGHFYLATDEDGGTLLASTGESWLPARVRVEEE